MKAVFGYATIFLNHLIFFKMFNPNAGFDMSAAMQNTSATPQWGQPPMQVPPLPTNHEIPEIENEEGDQSRRPPNAFILYSQAMRSQVRQENPSLSNTEVSRLLGKMWKEVPNEIKLQYKQKAAASQEEFKRLHPDYTYRKARRKRALNELLNKTGAAGAGFPGPFPGGFQDGFTPWAGMPMSNPMLSGMQGMNNMPGMSSMGTNGLPGGMPGMGTNQTAGFPGATSQTTTPQPPGLGGIPQPHGTPGQPNQPQAQQSPMFQLGGFGGMPNMFAMNGFPQMQQNK